MALYCSGLSDCTTQNMTQLLAAIFQLRLIFLITYRAVNTRSTSADDEIYDSLTYSRLDLL